jgi:DcuC family C4-dicarboxylate transporter
MLLAFGLVVIVLAVAAILRGADVRLALLLAALAMGAAAARVNAVVYEFFATFSNPSYVLPICCAMGFAFVLRQTGCDRQLVHLLVRPIRRVRPLLVPGAVLVGFVVNIPVISQSSTAVAAGAVLVPLLRAAGVSPLTAGAALLLGSSVGGELLNPGAPEYSTVSSALGVERAACQRAMMHLVFVQLGVATLLFWLLSVRADRRAAAGPEKKDEPAPEAPPRLNVLQALVPLLPIAILLVTGPPFGLVRVPTDTLVPVPEGHTADEKEIRSAFDSRLIAAAMLVGVAAAAATAPRRASASVKAFCEGAGYGFTQVITLIVTAACFSKAVGNIGVGAVVTRVIESVPGLLIPAAGLLPAAFAAVSGSGIGSTQGLFGLFVGPAKELGIDPVGVGAVVSLGAAAGRTMSPVAAVALVSAALTSTSPFALARRVALPVVGGLIASLTVAVLWLR